MRVYTGDLRGLLQSKVAAEYTKRHFRALEDKFKALCVISWLQTDWLQLMETVITNKAMDSSQTEISGEGCWDSWRYGVFLSLLLACAISVSKCSSFIYYLICFTPLFLFLFHIHHLASAHLVELYLFLEPWFSWQSSPSITGWPSYDLKLTDLCSEDTCCCTVHTLTHLLFSSPP